MTFKYQIFKEENLLVQQGEGLFDFILIQKYIHQLIRDPDWVFVKKIFSDYRNLIVPKTPEIISNISELANVRNRLFQKPIDTVVLVDSPEITANIHLYTKKLNTNSNTESNTYCSSIEHGIEILQLKMTPNELKQALSHLKKTFSNEV